MTVTATAGLLTCWGAIGRPVHRRHAGLHHRKKGASAMTDSTSTILALLFGLGVFAILVAVGWRSVQNRRILRLQGTDGRETIIVAGEDDDVSSVVSTATTVTTETAETGVVGGMAGTRHVAAGGGAPRA
jgi:hypothetical protein